jgi:energy-coupling factor transporter transmembrane protein EcfT
MQESYIQVLADRNRINLDPRTKIVTLLIINVSAFTVNAWYVMALAAAIPLSLFILKKQLFLSVILAIIYFFSLCSYVFLIDSSVVVVNIIVGMLTGVINRMGPGLFMGYYLLTTTTVSEFIASMERIGLPKQIIIPLSVMFRFFPTIKEESSSINDAMKMRGIRLGSSRGGPVTFMEYRLVPLLISCVKIGEELSCSALTRGLGSPVERTNICKIGFRAGDYIYLAFSALLLLLLIQTKGI